MIEALKKWQVNVLRFFALNNDLKTDLIHFTWKKIHKDKPLWIGIYLYIIRFWFFFFVINFCLKFDRHKSPNKQYFQTLKVMRFCCFCYLYPHIKQQRIILLFTYELIILMYSVTDWDKYKNFLYIHHVARTIAWSNCFQHGKNSVLF